MRMYVTHSRKFLISSCPYCGKETYIEYRDPSWCKRTYCYPCKTWYRAIFRQDNKCVRCSTRGKCLTEGMTNITIHGGVDYNSGSASAMSYYTATTGASWYAYDVDGT